LFPDSINENHKEILFIRETNNRIVHWEGEKLTKSDAFEISGIKNVHWLSEFDEILSKILKEADHVYINTNEHYRQNVQTQTREDRFIEKLKNFGGLNFKKSNPILQYQRSVKDEIELNLIKKACHITKKGFERVLGFVKPGVWEYEIEAEFSHEFLKNRFNKSLESIGVDKIFDVDQSLVSETEWFDDEIIGTKHGDFFVKRSINYSKRSQSITSDDLF